MNPNIESEIKHYLSDETKLYHDWYLGVTQVQTDGESLQVSVIPECDELKRLFEQWFNIQQNRLKKLCEAYCQKRQQFQHSQPLLIATVADTLSTVFMGLPINLAATATILVGEAFLDRLCDCPENYLHTPSPEKEGS
jgi:hypothetical protein